MGGTVDVQRSIASAVLIVLCGCPKTGSDPQSASSGGGHACEEGKPCVSNGEALERENKFKDAAAIYEKACEAGDAHGCRHLALLTIAGRGVPRSTSKGLELESAACDKGDGVACALMAERYWTGDHVYPDDKKARAAYVKAIPLLEGECDKEASAEACMRLGVVFTNGWGVVANLDRAEQAYKKAGELHTKACDAGDGDACAQLGRARVRGRGVPKDPPAGIALFEKGCSTGSASACFELAQAHKDDASKSKAALGRHVELLGVACEAGATDACMKAASIATKDLEDKSKAEGFAKKACEHGSGAGCRDAGDAKAAFAHFEKACEAGDGADCGSLGLAYLKGEGTSADAKKAQEALEKGCKLADSTACIGIAQALADGKSGIKKDVEKARALYEKACNLGKKEGCDKATKPK